VGYSVDQYETWEESSLNRALGKEKDTNVLTEGNQIFQQKSQYDVHCLLLLAQYMG